MTYINNDDFAMARFDYRRVEHLGKCIKNYPAIPSYKVYVPLKHIRHGTRSTRRTGGDVYSEPIGPSNTLQLLNLAGKSAIFRWMLVMIIPNVHVVFL